MTAMTLHDRENLHTHARSCHGKFRILPLSLHRYVQKYSGIKKVHLQGICRVISFDPIEKRTRITQPIIVAQTRGCAVGEWCFGQRSTKLHKIRVSDRSKEAKCKKEIRPPPPKKKDRNNLPHIIPTCKISIYLLACRADPHEPVEEVVVTCGVMPISSMIIREVVPEWRVGQFLGKEVWIYEEIFQYGNRGAERKGHVMDVLMNH